MTSRPRTNVPLGPAGASSKKEGFLTNPDELRSEICPMHSSFDMIISKEERRNYLKPLDITKDRRKALHDLIDRLPDAKIESVFNLVADRFSASELPDKAPELYKERSDRTEKPDAFIRRVYEPWLGKGLLRPHIKDLDKSLYQALYKHGIPDDFETLLPTAQGRAVEHLALSDAESLQRRRELTKASVKRWRLSRLV